jgi:hypothetical protein
MLKYILLFSLLLTSAKDLPAQLSPLPYQQAGAPLEQSFNGLPVSGSFTLTGKGPFALNQLPVAATAMQGWYILQTSVNQPNINFSTSTGSATGSGVYSFGASGNQNRALGSIAAGTGVYAFGLVLKNETGIILNRIQMRFLVTQWRKGGSGNSNTWRFGYQYGDSVKPATDSLIKNNRFNLTSLHSSTGAATLNGHLAVNQIWVEDSLSNIRWLPGQELLLQWSDVDETGSDDAMAIDDFSFKAFQQAGVPTISTVDPDSIGSRHVVLRAIINDQLLNTSAEVQIDTAENFLTAYAIQPIVPPAIPAGSGDVSVRVSIDFLLPAKKYYYRFAARNQQGVSYGLIQQFITKPELAVVQTDSLLQTGDNSCRVFGSISSTGGGIIQESGICWGTDSFPSINHNSILIADTTSIFSADIHQLPSGTKIFFRTYCKNAAGIAYGNILSWFTPTSIISFKRNESAVSNNDTIIYELQFKEKVTGIKTDHFQLVKNADSNAEIIQLINNHVSWQIVINTGTSNGNITPVFSGSGLYEPAILNTPFTANTTQIDKTRPVIRSVNLANRPYKSGDTIHVFVHTDAEKKSLTMIAGNLLGYPLQQFSKVDDSTWKTFCVIKNGGREITAYNDIETTILLSDEAGNQNNQPSFLAVQNNDAIDLTRPLADRIILPEKSLYKAGDSLLLYIQFSEVIVIDSSNGTPLLSVTIGTRIRNPFLLRVQNNQLFTFCYIIQPDELDMDGIRVANSITLNNAIITDLAGNLLNNNIPNAGIFSAVKVDAVSPFVTNVITPIARTYGIGDSLYFHVFVSESLVSDVTQQTSYLEITIGNTVYQATYLAGSNHPLTFFWVVQKETSDKNGISIRNILLNNQYFSDSIGNKLEAALKNIGSLSNVLVDGIAPVFKGSVVLAEICAGSSLRLADAVKFDMAEQNEILSWTILSAPTNRSITGLPFSSKWSIGNPLSSTIIYTPASREPGFDECIIQVSDGANTSFQKIKIKINPPIAGNHISANQIICAGFSAHPLKGNQPKGGNGNYQFSWESNSSSGYQKAGGVYEQEIYHPQGLHTSTQFRRVVSSGGCTDTSNNIVIEVRNKGLWLGTQSDNWHTGSNWCGGLTPDRQTDVYITHSGNKNIIQINDSAFCKSLFIDTSELIMLNAPLVFTGTLSGLSNINAEYGTLIAAGKEKQFLQSNIFINKSIARLIISGFHLELNDTLHISDYFSVQKGTFNTNDRLYLQQKAVNHPNAPGTGLKGRLSIPKHITGRQKELLMHHPFKNELSAQTIADSIYTLNIPQTLNKNWPVITWESVATNNNMIWPSLKGIVLSKPGFPSLTKDSLAFLLSGAAFTGDVVVEFTTSFDSSYLLTGNPYLSVINSKHITRSEGIGNYYWVWDTSLATHGAYRSKAFSANNMIQVFDGFIIKTTSASHLFLSYSEQAKLMTTIPDSLKDIIENTYQLEIELLKDNIIHDKLLILDVDAARTRYDAADAEKMFNPESNLYSLTTDTIPLSVDARWLTDRTSIPIGIDTKSNGQFMLRFSRVWLKPGIDLELHDLYTGSKIKIDTNKSYQFHITQDAGSFGRNRFVIRSPQQPDPPEDVLLLNLYPVPTTNFLIVALQAKQKALTTILIKNLQGQVLISRSMGEQQTFTHQMNVNGLFKGHYIVEVHSGKYVIAKTFIKL